MKISDFIKGLDNKDYIISKLIEDGLVYSHKQELSLGYSENSTLEWCVIKFQRDDRNFGNPFPVMEVKITNNPSGYIPKVSDIDVSITKDFFFNYGEKLLSEVSKSFPHKKPIESPVSDNKIIYFLNYTRDIDNVEITYSFQNDDYCFTIYKRCY